MSVANPFNYSDKKFPVYFEVADKVGTKNILVELNFVEEITEKDFGFIVKIAIQQIPEILYQLINRNIAVYAVIPEFYS